MTTTFRSRDLALLAFAVIVLAGVWFINPGLTLAPTTPPPVTNQVAFGCDGGKSIDATFYPDNDQFVDLVLSDGRALSVPHAMSASGARYANSDESFVFWNKGDTAFITENGTTTFANCLLIQQ